MDYEALISWTVTIRPPGWDHIIGFELGNECNNKRCGVEGRKVAPQGAVAGDGAVGDAEQLDERQLLLQRLLGACAAHVERVGDEAVNGKGVFHGPEKEYGD